MGGKVKVHIMEDFTPEKLYHPEDEYEALDGMTEQLSSIPHAAPSQEPSQPEQRPAQPYEPPYMPQQASPEYAPPEPPVYSRPPVPPEQAAAPQPTAYPQQQVYPQPVQQPYPGQPQSVYPQPPQQPYPGQPQQVYPQPPQQPYPNQPQPTYPQPPVQHQTPLSPNPYVNNYQQQPRQTQPKPPTPTGTKVFIIVLCALLAAMVIGFVAYIVSKNNQSNAFNSNNNSFSIDNKGGSDSSGSNPFGSDNMIPSGSYTEVSEEISLKADNGETQKRDDDNKDSVGTPDKNAKDIVLNPLPKDQNDEKYTTQSAYDAVSDSVVTVVCYKDKITDKTTDIVAQGTGTIITADGYIITNAHVIGNSRMYAINIVLNNSDKYPAKVIGYDTWSDLAVLKIDAKDLKPVTFGDSSLIKIGDDVIAIGSPGGEKFQNSLTKGIVSAVDRELTVNKYVRYIQSDAAISPGSSGGPLCNIYGQVIGITTAKTVAQNYENMSFSIPSATVANIVGDLMRNGYVQGRTRIGITGMEVSAEEAYYNNVPAGVIIQDIDKEGSLADSGIRSGDIITELDGKAITSFQDIYDVLADHKPDDKVTIKVQRPSNSK